MEKVKNKLILDKQEWDNFIVTAKIDGGFLQSWDWGEFQRAMGREVFRIVVEAEGKVSAAALIIKYKLPFGGNYLYVPRGPVVGDFGFDAILSEIRKLCADNHSLFLRVDPSWNENQVLKFHGFDFVGQVQPKKTLILDLRRDEAGLLSAMKPKTRYNIKIAQKHGVLVKKAEVDNFNLFWDLMIKTCRRDGIKSHPKNYYQKQLKIPGFKLVLAWWQNKSIAGAIINDFGDTRTYVHGASDYDFRDKMAPYLLQWEMIKSAKAAAMDYYDFWGADPDKWPGVTRFKQGFASQTQIKEYIGAYDLVLKPSVYRLYRLLRK